MESFPCSPEDRENCRVFEREGECYEDVHHEYWPERDYKTKVERQFRALEINKVFICRALHNEIHARRRRSEKPPRKEMLRAIQEEKDK